MLRLHGSGKHELYMAANLRVEELALCRRGALLCCPSLSPTAGGELPQLLVVLGITSGWREELSALGLLARARHVLFFYAQSPSDQPETCAAESIEVPDDVQHLLD